MKSGTLELKSLHRRLSDNIHLLRYAYPSSLRRTTKYASFLRGSRALYLNILQQSFGTQVY